MDGLKAQFLKRFFVILASDFYEDPEAKFLDVIGPRVLHIHSHLSRLCPETSMKLDVHEFGNRESCHEFNVT
jgi:hypothetical protein